MLAASLLTSLVAFRNAPMQLTSMLPRFLEQPSVPSWLVEPRCSRCGLSNRAHRSGQVSGRLLHPHAPAAQPARGATEGAWRACAGVLGWWVLPPAGFGCLWQTALRC